jgi:hypothetical protein
MSESLNPNTPIGHRLTAIASLAYRHLHKPLRIALAALFIWSGIAKLIDPQSFVLVIQAFGLLPDRVIPAAALGLASLELMAGVGLLFNRPNCLEAIAAMLTFFISIVGYGLWLGLDIDCGCFGSGDPEGAAYRSLRPTLYRDMIMLMICGWLYYRQRKFLIPVKEKM